MKNPPFIYHRPSTLREATKLLNELGDGAKVLAGGQSLLPILALRLGRPEHIVDISRLSELDIIEVTDDGVSIGALVRHARAERSDDLAQHAPLAHQAIPHVGHRAIRTLGTVCGSIAHADPAAELPAVCLASSAVMTAASLTGTRQIPASQFFGGYLTTALEPHELLTRVTFPPVGANYGSAVVEESRRHSDFALLGLACSVTLVGGAIDTASLSFFGAASTPIRATTAEAALHGQRPNDATFAAAAELVKASLQPGADIHASANYRLHLAGVLTKRGLALATANVRSGASS